MIVDGFMFLGIPPISNFLQKTIPICMPMDKREYDIILYGASGFAASFVIKELERFPLRIAVSSRSISRISETMLPRIECSIKDMKSLACRTRILINCVGPYSIHGEEIIKACIETGTHYLDICGEPLFLEMIYKKYNDEAKERNVKIIQCCGFDSLPADIGTYLLSKNHNASKIEIVLSLKNFKIHKTTWDFLLLSLINFNKLQLNRRRGDCIENPVNGNSQVKNVNQCSKDVREYKYISELGSYVVKFRGSDPYVVKRSSEFFKRKDISDVKICHYLKLGSVFSLILYYIVLSIVYFLVKFEWTAHLLRKYPGIFSFGLVTDKPCAEDIHASSFEMQLKAVQPIAKKEHKLTISGPNPGYLSTAIFVSQSAFTLLEEEDKIRCGILTPAVALYKTRIVERLSSKGIFFKYDY